MKLILRILFYNVAILCIVIVGSEILGQLAYFAYYGYTIFSSDQHTADEKRQLFEVHPYLVGRPIRNHAIRKGDVTMSTTDIGTRWTGGDVSDTGKIRVAVLGGSTAFGTKVTDTDTWAAILQARLGPAYSVMNYGVPGYSTAENIIQMSLIVPEIRPSIVIVYSGWNDIRNYHEPELGADYYGHGIRQFDNLALTNLQKKKSGFDNLGQASAIFRFARYVGQKFANPIPADDTSGPSPSTDPDPAVNALYLRNLRTIKHLAEQLDTQVMFVPQVLNYDEYRQRGETSERWTPHILNKAMPDLMNRFNQIMDSVCEPYDKRCSVAQGVGQEAGWLPDDFADTGHFSRKGGEKFVEILGPQLRQRLQK